MSPGRRWNSANGIARSPSGPGHVHDGLERRQRHAHVRRVRGDAVLAGAEDRVDAVEAVDRRAARARARACCRAWPCRRSSSSACAASGCRRSSPCCAAAARRRPGWPATAAGSAARPARRRRRRVFVTSAPIRRPPSAGSSIVVERQAVDVDQPARAARRRPSSGRGGWCRRR